MAAFELNKDIETCLRSLFVDSLLGDYPFSTPATFSQKLTFLTPWYAYSWCFKDGKLLQFLQRVRTSPLGKTF